VFARAQTVTAMSTTAAITVAALRGGIIVGDQAAAGAATYTLPTGTAISTEMPDLTTGDCIFFSITNVGTNAAEIITLAGDTGSVVGPAAGNVTFAANDATTTANTAGTIALVMTGANAFQAYRVG